MVSRAFAEDRGVVGLGSQKRQGVGLDRRTKGNVLRPDPSKRRGVNVPTLGVENHNDALGPRRELGRILCDNVKRWHRNNLRAGCEGEHSRRGDPDAQPGEAAGSGGNIDLPHRRRLNTILSTQFSHSGEKSGGVGTRLRKNPRPKNPPGLPQRDPPHRRRGFEGEGETGFE